MARSELTEELFFDPLLLKSTQDSECPSISHVYPYDKTKDPGIHIGVDEHEVVWILDGHRRVGSARTSGTQVRIGSLISVLSSDMRVLAEG